jgi:uncharacterized membrane protein YdjX (TVP38/TMEM64 family)
MLLLLRPPACRAERVRPRCRRQAHASLVPASPPRRAARMRGAGVCLARGDGDASEDAAPSGGSATPLALIATAVPAAAALAFVVASGGPQPALTAVQDGVAGAGPLGPLYFGAAYVAATVALLPASPLTLAAGYLFGTAKGTVVVSLASTAAAAASFALARGALRPLVAERLRSGGPAARLRALDAALRADAFRGVLLVRLSPLFPFSASNYAFGGLTSVPFLPYVAATWAGALPATVAYVALGAAGREAADAAAGGAQPVRLVLLAVGVAATLLLARAAAQAASAALADASGAADEEE